MFSASNDRDGTGRKIDGASSLFRSGLGLTGKSGLSQIRLKSRKPVMTRLADVEAVEEPPARPV
jgi:hypothetical protein